MATKKLGMDTMDSITGTGSIRRGTLVAADTNFKEKEKAARIKTPGPGNATEAEESREGVVQVQSKVHKKQAGKAFADLYIKRQAIVYMVGYTITIA